MARPHPGGIATRSCATLAVKEADQTVCRWWGNRRSLPSSSDGRLRQVAHRLKPP